MIVIIQINEDIINSKEAVQSCFYGEENGQDFANRLASNEEDFSKEDFETLSNIASIVNSNDKVLFTL